MGKAPASQWYFKDWLSDTELQMASSSTRGIWMNALCHMWEAKEKGKISGTPEELATLLRACHADVTRFVTEVVTLKFADCHIDNAGVVTLINRRMYREHKLKENAIERQRRHRERQRMSRLRHKNVTAHSSSSTPVNNNKDGDVTVTNMNVTDPKPSDTEPQPPDNKRRYLKMENGNYKCLDCDKQYSEYQTWLHHDCNAKSIYA